jgi:hypothetical protein
MPLAYNLLTEALNVRSIGSNGNAMVVVSGGGPIGEIVACCDILRGCGGGLMDPQPARIAVSAIAAGQHDSRIRMRNCRTRATTCDRSPVHFIDDGESFLNRRSIS